MTDFPLNAGLCGTMFAILMNSETQKVISNTSQSESKRQKERLLFDINMTLIKQMELQRQD